LVAVASEHGLPFWGAIGTSYRSWVKVKNGDVAEGISLLRSGTAAFRGTGAELFPPYPVALLLHHSHVVTIRGDSYRLREKRRTGLLKAPAIAPSVPAQA
jgi:hypothetical protein